MSDVQKMYDESGTQWNATRRKKYVHTLNWPVIQKYLDTLPGGSSILDVGCGNGRLVSGLPENALYTGIDFSRTLLHEAKKNFPDYDFRYANIVEESAWEALGRYNAVFCIAVLHHIPERDQQIFVLKHMKSHTEQGGFLCLSVWNLSQERFLQYHLDSLELKKGNDRWVEIPFAKKWKRFCFQMDIPYLVDIMSTAGWDITEIYFSDNAGRKSDIQTGQNIVVIAR